MFSKIIAITPKNYWGEMNENQQRTQIKILRSYSLRLEQFQLLFCDAPEKIQKQITETHTNITNLIERKGGWSTPDTIEETKGLIQKDVQIYYQLLQLFETSDKATVIFVPDTNALINCPDISLYGTTIEQTDYTVVFIPTVLSELDKLKRDHRDMNFRNKVDSVIRRIKGFRQQGSLLEGVTVNKIVKVKMIAQEPNFNKTLSWLDTTNNDDRVIATALELQRKEPSNIIILVTSDINHQNKAKMANLPYVEPPTV
jgi:rRNA maturation endonuclease Nob1